MEKKLVHLTVDHIEYLIRKGKPDGPRSDYDSMVTLYRLFRTVQPELDFETEIQVLEALHTINNTMGEVSKYRQLKAENKLVILDHNPNP